MKNKLLLMALSAATLVIFTVGCALGAPVRILVTDQGWDSQKFHNQVAKFVIENGFDGYVIEEVSGSSTLLWQDLLVGEIDLVIEEWTESVYNYQQHIASGYVIELGVIANNSAQGLYVPRFVIEGDPERGIEPMAPTLRTVADLIRYPHVFRDPDRPSRGRIYGGVPGWFSSDVLYKKYRFYGLDESFNFFHSGSEVILFASLDAAYNLGEAWVGYAWEPAWVIGRYDLILLEDAPFCPELYELGATEFPKTALMTVAHSGFPDRAPDLLDFFSRFYTGIQKISEALAFMHDTRATSQEAAIWFLKKYDYLLDEWLEPTRAARVREALSRI